MTPELRRALMMKGRESFNRAEFFDAHEHWEEVWDEADDPDRRYIQGLIQIATGLHKLDGEKFGPARTLLEKALAKLEDVPPDFDGFDVGSLKQEAQSILEKLRAGPPRRPAAWPKLALARRVN
jgi:predicted metal-dependent hydrolase